MTKPGPKPKPPKYNLEDYLLAAERAEADTRRQAAIVAGASAEAEIARTTKEITDDIDRAISRADQDRPGMWSDDWIDDPQQLQQKDQYDEPPLPPISAPNH